MMNGTIAWPRVGCCNVIRVVKSGRRWWCHITRRIFENRFSPCGTGQERWPDIGRLTSMSKHQKATTTPLPSPSPPPGAVPGPPPPPPPPGRTQKESKEKKREDGVMMVFKQLCTYRLPHLSYDDSFVMVHVLDCPSMDDVWTYALAGYNSRHFTRLIQKCRSLAEHIVDRAAKTHLPQSIPRDLPE